MHLRENLKDLESITGTISEVFIWSDRVLPATPSMIGKEGATYLRLEGQVQNEFTYAHPVRIDKGEKVKLYVDKLTYRNYNDVRRSIVRVEEPTPRFPTIPLRAIDILDNNDNIKCTYYVSR